MKKVIIVLILLFLAYSSIYIVYGNATDEAINETASSEINQQLNELSKKADNKVEYYTEIYGTKQYGYAAFILNAIRIYSIPVCFLGIVYAAIKKYIIGLKRLDIQEQGLAAMVGFITLLVICQVIPLIFAIVVLGWRG